MRGLWFLTSTRRCVHHHQRPGVSVPLRGLWFLTILIFYKSITDYQGFRPLAGIMVLNSPPCGWRNDAIENGVCGADFIFAIFRRFMLRITSINHEIWHYIYCGAESHVKPLRQLFLLYHFLYFYTLYRHRI